MPGEGRLVSPEDKEKRSIFVCMRTTETRSVIWFRLPEKEMEMEMAMVMSMAVEIDGSPILPPCFESSPPNSHYLSAYAALGPFIFVVGGTDPPGSNNLKLYKDVYVIDSRYPDKGWKKAPALSLARAATYAFPIGPTLCVIGGQTPSMCQPFAEVLDLNLSSDFTYLKWNMFKTSYKCVTFPTSPIACHAILYEDDVLDKRCPGDEEDVEYNSSDFCWYDHRISCPSLKDLFALDADGILHCYRFHSADWIVKEEFEVSTELNLNSELVGACAKDIMYLLGPKLVAYSLTKKKWFSNPICGFEKYPNATPVQNGDNQIPSCLMHLGNGMLCIIWTSPFKQDLMKLYCTKFTVTVDETPSGLYGVANVKSSSEYVLQQSDLLGGVAVSSFIYPFMEP